MTADRVTELGVSGIGEEAFRGSQERLFQTRANKQIVLEPRVQSPFLALGFVGRLICKCLMPVIRERITCSIGAYGGQINESWNTCGWIQFV